MSQKLTITNVSVIPMTSDEILRNQNVVVTGELIESISNSESAAKASGQVIDGTGKYLMPGLFDMHTHMNDESFLPLFLMNGVTAIRELGNVDDNIFRIKEDAKLGKILSPRMFVSGKILEGNPPLWDGFKVIKTKLEAVAAVRELKERGADFVKVYHTLSPDLHEAILEEAKKLNLKVTGHIPNNMTVMQALEAGQGCIEHMSQITRSVGKVDHEDANEAGYEGWSRFTGYQIDEEAFSQLLDSLEQHHTYICPTLVVEQKTSELADYKSLASQPEAAFMSDTYIKEEWNPNHKNAALNIKGVRQLWFENFGVIFNGSKTLIKRLAQHATILAGSDTPNPFVIPGFSLLDELELLVQSGLSPYQSLQAATTNAAQYLDVSGELGTIEAGKVANMVLLSKNPLSSITNVRSTEAVVLNGQYHDVEGFREYSKK